MSGPDGPEQRQAELDEFAAECAAQLDLEELEADDDRDLWEDT